MHSQKQNRRNNWIRIGIMAANIALYIVLLLAMRRYPSFKSVIAAAVLLIMIGSSVLLRKLSAAPEEEAAAEPEMPEQARQSEPDATSGVDAPFKQLLAMSCPSGRIYQVFRGPSHYVFIHVGNELAGIKEDQLLRHTPSLLEAQERSKKNYAIAKSDVQSVVLKFGTNASTKIPNTGELVLRGGGKKRTFILVGSDATADTIRFFDDVADRVQVDEKRLQRYQNQQNKVQQHEAVLQEFQRERTTPERSRKMKTVRTILLTVEIIVAVLFATIATPYLLLSVLNLLLFAAAVALLCCFPADFDLSESNDKRYTQSVNNLMLLLVPLFPLAIRSLLDFNPLQWGKAFVFAAVLGAAVIALLLWRSKPLRRQKGFVILLAILLIAFCLGPVLQLNNLLDVREPEFFCGEVIDMHISHSKTTSYNVDVQLPDGRELDLQTYPELYETLTVGGDAWVAICPGGLGISHAVLVE